MRTLGSINSVILKVASRCNLNCSYCYVYNHGDQSWLTRPKLMDGETFENTLRALKEHCEAHQTSASILFHGGEPTLVGPERFALMAARAVEVLGTDLRGLSIQTNAVLVDTRWTEVFRDFAVQVGVSLDGPSRYP